MSESKRDLLRELIIAKSQIQDNLLSNADILPERMINAELDACNSLSKQIRELKEEVWAEQENEK